MKTEVRGGKRETLRLATEGRSGWVDLGDRLMLGGITQWTKYAKMKKVTRVVVTYKFVHKFLFF